MADELVHLKREADLNFQARKETIYISMHVLPGFGLKEKSCVDQHSQIPFSSERALVEAVGCWALTASGVTSAFWISLPLSRCSFWKSQYQVFYLTALSQSDFSPDLFGQKCSPYFTLPLLSCAQLSFLLLRWNWLHFTEASNREDLSP